MKTKFLPIAINGDFRVRPLTTSDLDLTLKWRNDSRSRLSFISQKEITFDQHFEWFQKNFEEHSDFVFIILRADVPVGQISLYQIDSNLQEAEIGRILTDPDLRGQGIMQQGIRMAHAIAQQVFGLESLYLTVRRENTAAIHLYTKLGYAITGEEDNLVSMRHKLVE